MQVGTGAVAGAAHEGYDGALGDFIAYRYVKLAQMGINCNICYAGFVCSMVNHYPLAKVSA